MSDELKEAISILREIEQRKSLAVRPVSKWELRKVLALLEGLVVPTPEPGATHDINCAGEVKL